MRLMQNLSIRECVAVVMAAHPAINHHPRRPAYMLAWIRREQREVASAGRGDAPASQCLIALSGRIAGLSA